MAKREPDHLDFHFDSTWDYITGAGDVNPAQYYPAGIDGLPHELFHIFYYAMVYIGGPVLALVAVGLFIAFLDEVK